MDGFWAGLKVIAATGLVVVAAAWTARVAGKRMAVQGRGRHMAVVESMSLGPQRGLFLVSVAQRFLVIGSSRDGLNLLAAIPADEALALGLAVPSSGADGPRPGAAMLGGGDGTRSGGHGNAYGGDQLLSRLTSQIGELRRKLGGGDADRNQAAAGFELPAARRTRR